MKNVHFIFTASPKTKNVCFIFNPLSPKTKTKSHNRLQLFSENKKGEQCEELTLISKHELEENQRTNVKLQIFMYD